MKSKSSKAKKLPVKKDLGNPIHIKFEYQDAMKSKRDILFTEMNLLRILKIIQKYHSLRTNELEIKLKLYKKTIELKSSLKKIEVAFPKIRLPEILKDEEVFEAKEAHETENIPKRVKHMEMRRHDNELDYQLKEIQEKLRALSG